MSIPAIEAHEASYRAREVPEPAQVVPGVWAVPIPLNGHALRSITVFLAETRDGPVLIDAGYAHSSCWAAFQASLAVIGHRIETIRAVLLTHNHPDHVGFADRVRAASGATVAMGRADDFATVRAARGGFLDQLRRSLDLTGAPASVTDTMYTEALDVAKHHESLSLDVLLSQEQELDFGDVTIRAVPSPGHTYGHTVFLDSRGVLFTGDTMMAEGPTQLAIVSRPADDPAGDLLSTLDHIAGLGASIACPAHQFPYEHVATRAAELRAFHAAEVDQVRALAEEGATAWTIAPQLTWKKPWEQLGPGTRRFALMHTLALLRHVERAR
ncbi:MBL fold metallo-hydrolase [Dactylosporangium sp. NPDC000244]|uniref:MBL fold metallo-hydrolase n=1 Tax=Dactylosporangium sp. NPDC000244 TaxID=3154365 RepID=UPI003316FAE8